MKELHIRIKLPDDIPAEDKSIQDARRDALEAAVLRLWQAGHLSTRVAAKRLGLTYYDYLDWLGAKGIPILTEPPDLDKVDRLVERLNTAANG